jgi:photosystem II stability/assembly factor-like uncharacterized protein
MRKLYLIILLSSFFTCTMAQWTPTKGPYGGNVQCFYHYNNVLYAGTTCGLFISYDNGDSWNLLDIHNLISVTAIVEMGGRIFVGTTGGIFTSSDNLNWYTTNNGLSTSYQICGYCIRGFSVTGNTIYAATEGGLYTLSGSDTLWTFLNYGYYDVFAALDNIMIHSDRARYGPGASTYISTDAGLNFTPVYFPGIPDDERDLAFSLDVTPSGIYAVTKNYLYYSSDDGSSWTTLYNDSGDYRPTLVKIINNDIYLATEATGLLVSDINTISWSNTNYNTSFIIKSVYKNGPYLFVGNSGERGILRTNISSYNWFEKNHGLTALRTYAIKAQDNFVAASCRGGIITSNDSGLTWTRHDLRLPNTWHDKDNGFYASEMAMKGPIVLAGSDNIFHSVDSGLTWSFLNTSLSYPLAGLAIAGQRFVAIFWDKFLYSDDYGLTWNNGQLPPQNSLFTDLSYDSNILFLCDYRNIYQSPDSGQTWNILTNPQTTSSAFSFWGVEMQDTALFVVDVMTGLYAGNQNAANWFSSYSNNPNSTAAIYYLGLNSADFFLYDTRAWKLEHSANFGQTWTQDMTFQNHSLDNLGSSQYYTYASVPGLGIWRYPSLTNSMTTQADIQHPSSEMKLFPNPTTGLFTLHCPPSTSNSQLNIYNSLGELVHHQIIQSVNQHIDLRGEPKGVYFLEVSNTEKKEFRKIVLN